MAEHDNAPLEALQDQCCNFVACAELAVYRCHKCAKLYCVEHASGIDPHRFCIDCLKVEDCNILEMPLVDEEGVRHKGRVLRPVGAAFLQNNKLISDLSDSELTEFIKDYQSLLHQAENVTNLYRISLTQATHEGLKRELVKQKPSGEMYFPVPKPQVVRDTKPRSTKSLEDKLADAMLKAGITPEKLKAMIDAKRKAKAAS